MTIEHEGVHVTATNFTPSLDELKAYADFVKARVDKPLEVDGEKFILSGELSSRQPEPKTQLYYPSG